MIWSGKFSFWDKNILEKSEGHQKPRWVSKTNTANQNFTNVRSKNHEKKSDLRVRSTVIRKNSRGSKFLNS